MVMTIIFWIIITLAKNQHYRHLHPHHHDHHHDHHYDHDHDHDHDYLINGFEIGGGGSGQKWQAVDWQSLV